MSIKRYSLKEDWDDGTPVNKMVENHHGEYVLFDEVYAVIEKLKTNNDKLKTILDSPQLPTEKGLSE